ncbi:MAG: metallophosphatase family protein, partial [Lachnospiraceae bacterium]|nr:metallophosphatase family protein [Lachnospiraceae bacterium]
MKILVISDTHRRNENFLKVLDKVRPVDMLVHCGDVEGSESMIEEAAGCPVHMVRGNNDYLSLTPKEDEFMIGNYKVWLTHG